jgi:hypothetical protein
MIGEHMHYKRLSIILYGIIGLFIISLSIQFGFQYLVSVNQWIGLIIGIGLMLLSLVVYQFGQKHTIIYQISFFLNMIGIGLSITAYYVLKAYSLTELDFMVAILVSIGILIVFSLFSRIQVIKRHHKLFLTFFILCSFFISLILWLSSDIFTGLSFYYLNVTYFFMVGIVTTPETFKDFSKEIAKISFGAFILVSIIVLIILSEGEALSGLEGVSFDGVGGKGKMKRRNK